MGHNVLKKVKEFEGYCNEIVEKYQIPGYMIGLAKNGELFYESGFGFRDKENELLLSSDTVLGIGSVTKSFTCVAILQLQEAGKLSVQDPIIKYLPEFKTSNDEYTKLMTIHHFMTHSAGLPPIPSLYGAMSKTLALDPKFDDGKEEEKSPEIPYIATYEELMESIAKGEYALLGAPGTEFSYSNDCYALLGAVVERVSGITYEQYMKDYILEPAGMKNSVFHLHELDGHEDISNLYASRKVDDETIVFESNNPWDAPSMRAAGFLKSTVNDMLKYAEIFRNEGKVGDAQILTPESVEAMTTPFIQCGYTEFYGYGVMIHPDFYGYKLVEHGGSIKGVSAQLNIIPELGLTGFSNANLIGVPSKKLLNSAFADYLEKPIRSSNLNVAEINLNVEQLQEYVGKYVSGEGGKVEFSINDEGKLCAQMEGMVDSLVKPIEEDWFLFEMREDEYSIQFKRDEEGKISRCVFGFRQLVKTE
ncbi:beta-lactamase family protein [Arthrobacter citreus]|nr:beta-lactamase family protein [Arthrobacter citreus]